MTVTLSSAVALRPDGDVHLPGPLGVTTNRIQDLAGNDAAGLSGRAVTNNTPNPDMTAPRLSTATVDGAALVLTYDEALDTGSTPAAGAFTVRVAGAARTVSNVAVSGRAVTLTLSPAVPGGAGQTVTVSYDAPSANPVQDLAGNEAGDLSDRAVTNTRDTTAPSLVSAAVNGATLVLTYDEALDPCGDSVPAAADDAAGLSGRAAPTTRLPDTTRRG